MFQNILVLEAFTFENKKISLKTFIKLTLFSMGALCPPRLFPRRMIGAGLTDYCSLTIGYCFSYCFLEIFFGGQSHGRRMKLSDFEYLVWGNVSYMP